MNIAIVGPAHDDPRTNPFSRAIAGVIVEVVLPQDRFRPLSSRRSYAGGDVGDGGGHGRMWSEAWKQFLIVLKTQLNSNRYYFYSNVCVVSVWVTLVKCVPRLKHAITDHTPYGYPIIIICSIYLIRNQSARAHSIHIWVHIYEFKKKLLANITYLTGAPSITHIVRTKVQVSGSLSSRRCG